MAETDNFCWYEFWRSPWLHADQSWLEGPAWLADALALGRYHHQHISSALDIPDAPAPAPGPIDALLELSEAQRKLSCTLAGEIIAPGSGREQLEPSQLLWCRRTGAALRTKAPVERDTPDVIGLAALRTWQFEAWPRLCWLYDRQSVERANFLTLPPLREKAQHTLWQAILWQVTHGG